MSRPIGIIGASLAGLSCAHYLEELGHSTILFEKALEPGGRLATDEFEGFLLDRGFQVYLTSYPELQKIMRLYELGAGHFPSGINVYYEGKWYPFYNPMKHPFSVFQTRNMPFVSFADNVKLGSLYFKVALQSKEPIFKPNRPSMLEFLKEQGLSPSFIEAVIRPFFAGVLLNPALGASDELFLWLFHFFVEGAAALPSRGIRMLGEVLANKLKKCQLRYNTPVRSVLGRKVYLEGGEEVECQKIAIATDVKAAKELIGSLPDRNTLTTTTLYFALPTTAWKGPPPTLLHLNGEGKGPVNHVAFSSVVQPSYAPQGQMLIAATVLDAVAQSSSNLTEEVTRQLSQWFGIQSDLWRHLKTYRIDDVVPEQSQPPPLQGIYQIDRHPDMYLCGDYVDSSSIDGSIGSGRKAAYAIDAGIKREAELLGG